MKPLIKVVVLVCVGLLLTTGSYLPMQAQEKPGAPLRAEIALQDRVQPTELVAALQKSSSPLILQVGPRSFFEQAHILGAEFVGPAGTEAGLHALSQRVADVAKDRWIIVYCGCCPWDRCPNIRPALNQLHALGFTHAQALYLSTSFGADWVAKGYPVER